MIIENQAQLTDAVIYEMRNTANPRLKEILEALVRHLHGFARDVHLTEDEFNAAIGFVIRIGQLTTSSHNEVRLMAGSLGLSTLVCLLNNGDNGQTETSANLLGPFWRENPPITPNGGSILRSETPGTPMRFTGRVLDTNKKPVANAAVDVWHASTVGLYENQDPEQAEFNLRGRLDTDDNGMYQFWSVKPKGYPVPPGTLVSDLLEAQKRHPYRPAHVHALIRKKGFKTITSQLYSSDDPYIDSDAQFGVTKALIGQYVHHDEPPADNPAIKSDWYSVEHTFVLEEGEFWMPVPPVSRKATVRVEVRKT